MTLLGSDDMVLRPTSSPLPKGLSNAELISPPAYLIFSSNYPQGGKRPSLWAWQATLFSYRASGKSRIAVWGPAGDWVSTSGRGWRVLIYLSLSLPADAFSHAYS